MSAGRLYAGKKADGALGEVSIPPEKEGRWRVEEEFVRAIRGEERVSHTRFEQGVKYMDFTEAVARSAAGGTRVSLPLVV